MLDQCARFALHGVSINDGVLSVYKEEQLRKSEIPFASMHPLFDDDSENPTAKTSYEKLQEVLSEEDEYVPAKAIRKEPSVTKFDKMLSVFAGGKVESCRVDTDNNFKFRGIDYKISPELKQYQPKKTQLGPIYDMDRVYCFIEDGDTTIRFFDYSAEPISEYVKTA